MGWWSSTIMGGDTPLDFEGSINDVVGLGYKPKASEIIKKLTEGQTKFINGGIDDILNRWGCGKPDEEFYIDHKSIGFQVLAVMLMNEGIKINEELKALMLEWIPKDYWAGENEERKKHVDNLLENLNNYDPSNPVDIHSEGLLEQISKLSKTK